MPGPIAQTTASIPARAHATSAEAVETQAISPPKHGPTATVVSRYEASRSARTVSESGTGRAPPGSWT